MHDARHVRIVIVEPVGHHAVEQGGIAQRQALCKTDHAAAVAARLSSRQREGGRSQFGGKLLAPRGQGAADGIQNQMLGALLHLHRNLLSTDLADKTSEGFRDGGCGHLFAKS